jgi:hypothetical protein
MNTWKPKCPRKFNLNVSIFNLQFTPGLCGSGLTPLARLIFLSQNKAPKN